jgi:hypothetical protein
MSNPRWTVLVKLREAEAEIERLRWLLVDVLKEELLTGAMADRIEAALNGGTDQPPAVRACPHCGCSLARCEDVRSRGAIACCPDCDHRPTDQQSPACTKCSGDGWRWDLTPPQTCDCLDRPADKPSGA